MDPEVVVVELEVVFVGEEAVVVAVEFELGVNSACFEDFAVVVGVARLRVVAVGVGSFVIKKV